MKTIFLFLILSCLSIPWLYAQTDTDTQKSAYNAAKDSANNEIIYDVVEYAPEFPEGGPALNYYIEKNLVYPPLAKENNVQGKVFVNFVVDKKGVLKHIKVEKGLGSGCDEEAIRLVKKMPKW